MIDAAVRQNTALRDQRIKGPVRLYECKSFCDIASVSRANQAVSFDRISRSIRSCLFTRRNRHALRAPAWSDRRRVGRVYGLNRGSMPPCPPCRPLI